MITKIRYKIKWAIYDLASYFGSELDFSKRLGELQVLCFHGVCEDSENYINGRFIRKSQLIQLFSILKSKVNIVSWQDVSGNQLSKEKLNVLITFDDGYLNNKTILLPIIEELKVPIILFVTGRDGKPLWPDLLDVAMAEKIHLMDIFKNKKNSLDNQSIKKYMLGLDSEEIEKITIELLKLTKPLSEKYSNFIELLTYTEINDLVGNEYITIGNHSRNHLNMTLLDGKKIEGEFSEVNHSFQNLDNFGPELFAYPFGLIDSELFIKMKAIGVKHHFLTDDSIKEENVFNRLTINPFVSNYINIRSILNGKY